MELIDQFLRHLDASGYAHSTLGGYRCLLRSLHWFLVNRDLAIERSRESDLLDFLRDLESRQSKPVLFNSVCRLKVFYRYLVAQDFIFYSPIETYRAPKLRSFSSAKVSEEQMSALLETVRPDTPLHARTYAIIELAYSSALRSTEVRHLRIEHINAPEGTLFIERSKNRRDRCVPVGASALEAMSRYLRDVRPQFLNGKKHSVVFVSHRGGGPLSASGYWRGIASTLADFGIAQVSPHSFRASSATALLENGMHVAFIAELLGHTELSTTQVYLRMREQALTEEIAHHHPRASMSIKEE